MDVVERSLWKGPGIVNCCRVFNTIIVVDFDLIPKYIEKIIDQIYLNME